MGRHRIGDYELEGQYFRVPRRPDHATGPGPSNGSADTLDSACFLCEEFLTRLPEGFTPLVRERYPKKIYCETDTPVWGTETTLAFSFSASVRRYLIWFTGWVRGGSKRTECLDLDQPAEWVTTLKARIRRRSVPICWFRTTEPGPGVLTFLESLDTVVSLAFSAMQAEKARVGHMPRFDQEDFQAVVDFFSEAKGLSSPKRVAVPGVGVVVLKPRRSPEG